MKKRQQTELWTSLIAPVFLMTILLMPLLFIMVKRYYSPELIPLALVNGIIMTGGLFLNIFVYSQLTGRIHNLLIIFLIILSSAGFTISGVLYISITNSLFFLYGLEVMGSYMAVVFLIITSLSLLSSGFINYQRIVNEERARSEHELKLREEMERQIHSSRINPHFLFNSLNLMISLLDDRDKAEEVLIGLSELLRYNLDVSKEREIPLFREMESVRKYLFIQKERFGDRLDFKIDDGDSTAIPPLIIQPLVENSIKHNLDHCKHLFIEVLAERSEEQIILTVRDSEARLEEEKIGLGTGLEVTKQRVNLAGGKLSVKKGGVEICLPIK
ncbi:MAG: histidine kinase [Spirochaetales bacterium]|nr:histidine kinase [Spirochaetales bacterium]